MITVKRFTASWCGPCKILAPVMESLRKEYEPQGVSFETIDVDQNPDEAKAYNVSSVPTVIIESGPHQTPVRLVGVKPRTTYVAEIQRSL